MKCKYKWKVNIQNLGIQQPISLEEREIQGNRFRMKTFYLKINSKLADWKIEGQYKARELITVFVKRLIWLKDQSKKGK